MSLEIVPSGYNLVIPPLAQATFPTLGLFIRMFNSVLRSRFSNCDTSWHVQIILLSLVRLPSSFSHISVSVNSLISFIRPIHLSLCIVSGNNLFSRHYYLLLSKYYNLHSKRDMCFFTIGGVDHRTSIPL